MGRNQLKVTPLAALMHCSQALELSSSCRALELSSSALAPPCCSLSLYYPTVIPLMHLPLELHSQAGAYSSNHWLLMHTSAHTYWVFPETHTLGTHRKKCAIQWRICFPMGYLQDCQNGQLDDGKCSVMCTPSAAGPPLGSGHTYDAAAPAGVACQTN
jgi:hypothetical protein